MSNKIDANNAEVFFDLSQDGAPTENVLVTDRKIRLEKLKSGIRLEGGLRYSHGAMSSGWMKSGSRIDTPEGIFATYWLASTSRPSLKGLKRALLEFSKIEGCEWAIRMYEAIEADPDFGMQGGEN